MTSQPPLLSPGGDNLPSPMFRPQPGWGGKLSRWLGEHGFIWAFRIVIFVALVAVIMSLVRRRATQLPDAVLPTSTPFSTTAFPVTALYGDSYSVLAARALDAYVVAYKPKPPLKPVDHLFTVDRLWRSTPRHTLNPGDTVTFSSDTIASILTQARRLTQAQRNYIGTFLRK